jgi:muramoyltetrapeptide carboxypeptidase
VSRTALIYPPLLKKGDTIAIVAPASPPEKPKVIDAAIKRLKAYGFKIKPGKFLRERDRYVAGSDEQRAADINAAFADPGVQGVFCLRGGYGSCRILPLLDYAAIRANPKAFLGYSDITAMHLAILVKSGLVTFHGSNASSAFEPANLKWCEKMLLGIGASDVLFERDRVHKAIKTVVPGRARGKLIGGNFTCLLRLLGTAWQPDCRARRRIASTACSRTFGSRDCSSKLADLCSGNSTTTRTSASRRASRKSCRARRNGSGFLA